ncbi:aminotransferase class I/II-fold pyridoxal phosphate-dependent enzyme [Candidatus Gottesmanbacteria bacterium]|nr:aminotransferase class I/II-fold pyridoxal phosphate-dependent enzyme [Candidatus Gottesmanbacteria bacterium]
MTSHSVLASTGDTKILPEVAERLRNTSVSVIKEMQYLGSLEIKKGRDIVSLGVGLPFYPAPKKIHDHIIEKLETKKDIDKYTLLIGLPELREIFAKISSQDLGFPVSIDELLVTPGSMSGLLYSFLSIVNPGQEVILPSPYFSSHAEQISIAQGIVVTVPMIEDKKTGYKLDIEKIRKAINKKTKAIVINSPHNPTGAVFSKENLLELAEILKEKDIYVITDEVYEFLVFDGLKYFNIAKVKELWPKVIRCCSLSKKYGMMGWRLGFLHTNKDLLMNILKVHDSMIVCAPHISQEAAIAALTMDQNIVKHHVAWLEENRDIICKRMDSLPDLFSYVKPRGAYYAFPKYSLNIESIEMAKQLLFEAGVVTVPGIGFGPEGEQHLRLSFGSPKDEIGKAFDRIEKWWNVKKHSF